MGSFDQENSKTSSESNPLDPQAVGSYYSAINNLSGGRLQGWAQNGTQQTNLSPVSSLTPAQIQALGGGDASQKNQLTTTYNQQKAQVASDPTLDVFQKQRAGQLDAQDYNSSMDAINKENAANITGLAENQQQFAGQQNLEGYQARLANNSLTAQDMQNLANIYFGGKGNFSSSSGFSDKSAGSFASTGG